MKIIEVIAAPDFSKEKSKLNPTYEPISVDAIKPYKQQILFANECTPLYRGMKDTGDYIIADGRQLNRKSANTENYFTLLTEVLPSWSGWPPRSKSFVGSLSVDYAQDYAGVNPNITKGIRMYTGLYRMVPLENQDIGIMPTTDLHDYFAGGFNTLMGHDTEEGDIIVQFNQSLRLLLSYFFDNEPTTASGLVDAINFMENEIQKSTEIQKEILNELPVLGEVFVRPNLLDNIDTLIDPVLSDCALVGLSDISDGDSEIWLSGKVLFIKDEIFETVVEELEG